MKTKIKKEKLEDIIKRTKYYYVNDNLNSKNFPIPDKIETEGWKIISMDKPLSSQEALDKIKAEGCRPANAYELALWIEKHKEEVPKSKWYLALGQLWQDSVGYLRVPYLYAHSDGVFSFGLVYWEGDWNSAYVLLCFCDKTLPLDTLTTKSDSVPLTLSSAIKIVKEAGYQVSKLY